MEPAENEAEGRPDRVAQERQVEEAHRTDEPHHELANPVGEPDETEYPDPYEKRSDPRGPEASDPATAGPSTAEPPPPRNPDEERRNERGTGATEEGV
jgi:hypothetical protein